MQPQYRWPIKLFLRFLDSCVIVLLRIPLHCILIICIWKLEDQLVWEGPLCGRFEWIWPITTNYLFFESFDKRLLVFCCRLVSTRSTHLHFGSSLGKYFIDFESSWIVMWYTNQFFINNASLL
jgi:hypothetical protein